MMCSVNFMPLGCKGGPEVRALASHQCDRGSNLHVDAICGLSLLLVLSLASRGFLQVLQSSPLVKNQHFQIPIRSGTHGHISASSHELLSALWVNKQTKGHMSEGRTKFSPQMCVCNLTFSMLLFHYRKYG